MAGSGSGGTDPISAAAEPAVDAQWGPGGAGARPRPRSGRRVDADLAVLDACRPALQIVDGRRGHRLAVADAEPSGMPRALDLVALDEAFDERGLAVRAGVGDDVVGVG